MADTLLRLIEPRRSLREAESRLLQFDLLLLQRALCGNQGSLCCFEIGPEIRKLLNCVSLTAHRSPHFLNLKLSLDQRVKGFRKTQVLESDIRGLAEPAGDVP